MTIAELMVISWRKYIDGIVDADVNADVDADVGADVDAFFFIDPTPKLGCLALGYPSDQQHCTIAHTK